MEGILVNDNSFKENLFSIKVLNLDKSSMKLLKYDTLND